MLTTNPDIHLADGSLTPTVARMSPCRWMRVNEPVFRDRNCLNAIATCGEVFSSPMMLRCRCDPPIFVSGLKAMPWCSVRPDPCSVFKRRHRDSVTSAARARSANFWTLPVDVLGSSLKTTVFGALKWARRALTWSTISASVTVAPACRVT